MAGRTGHDRNSAMTVVPTSAVARKAIVSRSGEAPIAGGAARTASSPNAATAWAFARIAMAAATTATRSEPARPTSTGTRSYSRVAAMSATDMTPRPTATRTWASWR